MTRVAPGVPATDRHFAWPDGRRAAVSITFDDARLSQIDAGIPILDRFGVKATFYVSMPALDKRVDAWRTAAAAGHEIGNHTLNHPCSGNFRWSRHVALEDFTPQRMEAELDGAQEAIRQRLGVTPRTFAYPCGQTFIGRGERVQSYVPLVARRFVVGRTFREETHNDPGYTDLARAGSYALDGLTMPELRALLDAAVEAGAWLILTGHDVGERAYQGVDAQVLAELCRIGLDPTSGIWLDTAAAVGEYITRARATGAA